MNIEYTVHIWQESDQFVAHAMPLDVMSSGETTEMSRKALDEAVQLFLDTVLEIGTLEEVLEEAGYIFKEGDWIGPAWVSTERHATVMGV
ncbi:MAG: putative RNase H-like HicB family nuclease [Candidatus Latescibacterota bacterium]|jgi:predicted RNase H-like HicB family nuclease